MGFLANEGSAPGRFLGLISMCERVQLMTETILIESKPMGGTYRPRSYAFWVGAWFSARRRGESFRSSQEFDSGSVDNFHGSTLLAFEMCRFWLLAVRRDLGYGCDRVRNSRGVFNSLGLALQLNLNNLLQLVNLLFFLPAFKLYSGAFFGCWLVHKIPWYATVLPAGKVLSSCTVRRRTLE